jgi:hypothetical protein
LTRAGLYYRGVGRYWKSDFVLVRFPLPVLLLDTLQNILLGKGKRKS